MEAHFGDEENFIVNPEDIEVVDDDEELAEDGWDETLGDFQYGGEETLIQDENELNVAETSVQYAPGEGKRPLSLFVDELAEPLSFLYEHAAQIPQYPPGTTEATLAKYQLRNFDPRFRAHPDYLLYKNQKLTMIKVAKAIGIALRQGRLLNQAPLTAEQLLNQQNVDEFVRHDIGKCYLFTIDYFKQLLTATIFYDGFVGYRVLKDARCSPPFWESKTREGMAMLRQLGAPTFFLTLSPAERLWNELLVLLYKVINPTAEITEEEVSTFSDAEKTELIVGDPVTCARYFWYRVEKLLKFLEKNWSPFRPYKVTDYVRRIEFQHRGSPHLHSLLWLKKISAEEGESFDPPQYKPNNPECEAVVAEFIDTYITCSNTAVSPNLVNLQRHRHTITCKRVKGKENSCRFGFPRLPMSFTRVLDPLPDVERNQENLNNFKLIKEKLQFYWKNIRTENQIPATCNNFLAELGITEEQYILAIRQSLKKSTVFLRRSPLEININNYNVEVLQMHQANMDIQYVLDPYACVKYILAYINKANRGMSKLLRETVEALKLQQNSTLRDKLKIIAHKFLNSTEISAQEAVFYVLQMAVSMCSRDVSASKTCLIYKL